MNNKKNKTIEVPCLRLGEGNYSLGFREVADNPDGKPMIAIGVFKPDRKLVVGKPIPKDVKIPESPFYDSQGVKLDKPYTRALPVVKSDSSKGAGDQNLEETGARKYATYTHAKKTNLVYFARDSQKGCSLHPTQKPVALLEYLIKTYTLEGETVLDNCAGSMSTAIACLNTNRKGIMIEKDKEYFNVGCERIKRHILDNGIDLCYNQVKGGVIWQNLKIE